MTSMPQEQPAPPEAPHDLDQRGRQLELDAFGGAPDPWWRDGAERAVRALAATGQPFQLSQIRDEPYSVPEPHHPNAYGALARAMSTLGVITCVGYAPSDVPSRRGSVVRVWQGVGGAA